VEIGSTQKLFSPLSSDIYTFNPTILTFMKIKKGDSITVIAGKDRGKKGTVLRALPKADKVIIEGVNMRKKHIKKREDYNGHVQPGSVVERAMPMHVSNVMLIDPKSGKRTRVGYTQDKGKKVRIARKSGAVV
jgi:large subunit ribosomal protein L24